MVTRPRTGYERDPYGFDFSGVRVPPDDVLPPACRKLAAELRDHQAKHQAAKIKHAELTNPKTIRQAQESDALLLGEAVRADKELPGPVNVKALEEAVQAQADVITQHEAAGRLIAQDIDAKLKAAAAKGVTEERDRLAKSRDEHARALADLEAARQNLVTGTAALAYWLGVQAGEPTRWKGRTDGGGGSIIRADGQRVMLEDFRQLKTVITSEAARLAAAVDIPDETTEAA